MFSPTNENGVAAESWETIKGYDYIYADACAWMSQEMERFLSSVSWEMKKAGRHIILPACVRQEIQKCATEKYAARVALNLIDRYNYLVEEDPGNPAVTTADRVFAQLFFRNHNKRRQLLITLDNQLAADIRNLCLAPGAEDSAQPSTGVMSLWMDGRPLDFVELNRRKEELARTRLDDSVRTCPIYMDSTTLGSPEGAALLNNLREPMARHHRAVSVLDISLTPEVEDMLGEYLEGDSPMVRVVPADPDLSETDALLGEIYLGDANLGVDRVILVTDDLARATELRDRRPKSDHFPQIDFMSANKYGYLSYMRMQRTAPAAPRAERTPYTPAPQRPTFSPAPQRPTFSPAPQRPTFSPAPQRTPYSPAPQRWERHEDDPAGRKSGSYVPQLIGAIKSDNIAAMCEYLDKGANVRNGIITALCNDKNDALRVILDRETGKIEASCFRWWVVSFFSFSDPFYLRDNEEQYELLAKLIEKSAPFYSARNAMVVLCRQVSYAQAAHDRLWSIIRMAVENGAPVDVTSQETGENLLEIAQRHGNKAMCEFLAPRMQHM